MEGTLTQQQSFWQFPEQQLFSWISFWSQQGSLSEIELVETSLMDDSWKEWWFKLQAWEDVGIKKKPSKIINPMCIILFIKCVTQIYG